jgi:hypothetical protein
MFAGKALAYKIEVPFRCSTLGQTPGLDHKHYTRLERLASVITLLPGFVPLKLTYDCAENFS